MEQIVSELLTIIFGVAELILACVGGVDAGDHCQFGSWMMFVSLSVFLFVRRGKGRGRAQGIAPTMKRLRNPVRAGGQRNVSFFTQQFHCMGHSPTQSLMDRFLVIR
jgi:hypothetical protein